MNLRDELGVLADRAPSYADSGKALKKAKGRRARRLVAAPLAVAAVLAVSVPLALQGFGGKGAPTGDGRIEPEATYVTPNGTIMTPEKAGFTLEDWKPGGEVIGVPSGWVVIPEDGEAYLYRRSDGSTIPLDGITRASQARVSADGTRIAWVEPGTPGVLHAAELEPEGLTADVSSAVPDTVTVAGWSDSLVLLDFQPADMSIDAGWDSWDPAEGPFEPDWQDGTIEHMTSAVEGAAVNVERGQDRCMIWVDTRTNEEAGGNCRPFAGEVLAVSPDGEWLFVTMESAEEGTMVGSFIDTGNYFSPSPPQPIRGCGQGEGIQADWNASRGLVVLSGGRLMACSPQEGEISARDLPEGSILAPAHGD